MYNFHSLKTALPFTKPLIFKKNIFLCAFLSLSLFHINTLADNVESFVTSVEGKVIYQPAFFSKYAPQTAADVVRQIPGFSLYGDNRGGGGNNNQERGLGQGDENLLLNGKRISSKDNSPGEYLSRIPAKNITYVEILTQGSTELSGQSGQIVNVVYKDNDEANGSWTAHVHTLEKGETNGSFDASVAGKTENFGYALSLNRYANEFPQWGPEKAYDANGELWEIRDEYSDFTNRGLNLSLGLSWEGDDSQVANLNVSTSNETSTFFEDSAQYTVINEPTPQDNGLLNSNVHFQNDEDRSGYEISGDYSQKLGDGIWKIIALLRSSDNTAYNYFNDLPINEDAYLYRSISNPESSEKVVRSLYTLYPEEKHTLEFAIEGVKNTLETASTFSEDTGSGFESFLVEGSDVEISEDRAELSVQYSMPLDDDWSLTSLLATEYSKLSVSGIDVQSRSESFNRYKGFVSINGTITENSSLRTRIERSVGQLSFFDFASSQNINEGTNNGGNTNLVPEQTWRAEVGYEHTFSNTDIFTVTTFVERIDDFITFVPFGDGMEGRDNIDKLDRYGIELSSSVNLDAYGVKGGKLDLAYDYYETSYLDPVTGKNVSYEQNRYHRLRYNINFRQDIPDTDIAWGAMIEERTGATRYRLDQTYKNKHRWPQAHILFIEHKDIAGMTLRIETEDFFGFTWTNNRTFYEGDRNGDITGSETNSRHSPWVVRVSLSSNF